MKRVAAATKESKAPEKRRQIASIASVAARSTGAGRFVQHTQGRTGPEKPTTVSSETRSETEGKKGEEKPFFLLPVASRLRPIKQFGKKSTKKPRSAPLSRLMRINDPVKFREEKEFEYLVRRLTSEQGFDFFHWSGVSVKGRAH